MWGSAIRRRGGRRLALPFCGLFWVLIALPVAAQQPSAVVEEVRAADPAVEAFEYLWPDQTIHLGVGDELVLGYFKSCTRETITGGSITIGTYESKVAGGLVVREIVECDGGRAELSEAEASTSGVTVLRGGDRDDPLRIFSLTPAFTFSKAVSEIHVQRLDRPEPPIVIPVRFRSLDFARIGKSLRGGGIYEIRAGADVQVVKVAVYARPEGALLSRLVAF